MRTSAELVEACRVDGEFRLAARHWTGGLRLHFGDGATAAVAFTAGEPGPAPEQSDGSGWITLRADAELWAKMLAPVPPPFFNDVAPARARGLAVEADELLWWQYVPAVQRAVELLREPGAVPEPVHAGPKPAGTFDAPVGRYVHLTLADGHDHRIFFEEAGPADGIPVLCQHTAGSHSAQYRHLFEEPAITSRFRLIAYDLPFHGKSVPPTGRDWWTERYELRGAFLRSVPVSLAAALGLDRPVFMGCSVGGLLALDLALHHPDVFRAVISLEGALRVGGDRSALTGFWHPGVSNESKARMMEGLTWPLSPTPYRKETSQTYASGWPPAFLGDLQYYVDEYDLRPTAHQIDTSRVGVHILNGEYDYSATPEHGRTAHEAIAGSTFTAMEGMGHFPMSEHPAKFLTYLLPVLDQIAAGAAAPGAAGPGGAA